MSESGVKLDKHEGRRNFSDSDSNFTLNSCIEGARTDRNLKRKAAALTVDNADDVFAECFDLDTFKTFLDKKYNISCDREIVSSFMKSCVVDPEVVPFTGAAKRHLHRLGIGITGSLQIDEDRVAACDLPDSTANKYLRQDVIGAFTKHFSRSKESGCRCIIDQYLLASALYAQHIIDTDADIKAELQERYLILDPHVGVFTELPVPKTRVSNNGVSYTFHGVLDYGVGLIRRDNQELLASGQLAFDIENALSGIHEAKGIEGIQSADPQITMQVLTALALTGRTSFTGALSNGSVWIFYTAERDGESYRVCSSGSYAVDRHGGFIVELLKDMIIHKKSPLLKIVALPRDMKRLRTV